VPQITFDKPTRERLSHLLARRLKDELDVEIDPFDSLDLLEFLSQTLGPYYYNQGLHDAQAIFKDRIEAIADAVYELEQPLKG
jgi:uncharacterized protein (DUF2164 family)